MKAFFESDRLIFQPDTEADRRDLSEWWAQLQTLENSGQKFSIATATAEKALILFVPQR